MAKKTNPTMSRNPVAKDTLNAFFNGHQFFRIIYCFAVAIVWLGVSISAWFFSTGQTTWNVQIILGWLLIVFSIFLGERRYRRSHRFVPLRIKRFHYLDMTVGKWPDTSVSNLNMNTQYPESPFVLDFVALFLIVWGTGGLSSPFLSMLYFGTFASGLAVGVSVPLLVWCSLVTILAMIVPALTSHINWPWWPSWLEIARAYVADLPTARSKFEWRELVPLGFTVAAAFIFLILMSGMTAEAHEKTMAMNHLDQNAGGSKN